MMVIDSSAWIEWFLASEVADRLASHWPEPSSCLVPTLVQLELAKWARREAGDDLSDQIQAHLMTCAIIPMDTEIALLAADFCADYKLATADAIVYASARHRNASLLTCDAHFEGLPGAVVVRKTN